MTIEPRLDVTASADPQTLPRLLDLVAQLGAVPRHLSADAFDGLLAVTIVPMGLTERQIDIVAEKMRSSVLVASVRISWSDARKNSNEGLP